MDVVTINGLQIAYERRGEGAPLVLLHGAISDSRIWQPQLEDLSKTFEVVAWDAPGCGRSDDPSETFRLSDYADSLAGFITALDLKHPHVLGLSFGGGLALEFYQRHPKIPRSLILASAYAGWAGSLSPEAVNQRLNNGIQQSTKPPRQVVDTWIPTLFSKSTPDYIKEKTAEIMADFHPVGMRVMLRAFAEADLRHMLHTIRVPTLLLYGQEDRRSPQHVAQNLHKHIPDSELVFLPGVGHLSNMEAPERFNAAVRDFLTSNIKN